jgi:hypothetical protein
MTGLSCIKLMSPTKWEANLSKTSLRCILLLKSNAVFI